MTTPTRALFLAALSLVVLGLTAALGPAGTSHTHIATGGALEAHGVTPDGTPRTGQPLLWFGCAPVDCRAAH